MREVVVLGRGRIVHRRVVAQHDHLDALQPHHAIGLGPAAVVADRHADDAAERAEHREAQVADFEIALLEILERTPRLVLGVAGQVNLAVLAEDAAVLVDENRRVVAMRRSVFDRELRVAQVEADAELARAVEQRLRRRIGHLAFEVRVELILPVVVPVREEGGERAFRKHDEIAAVRRRLLAGARSFARRRSRGFPCGRSGRAVRRRR